MTEAETDFPPHLLGLEFLDHASCEDLFERLEGSVRSAPDEQPIRLGWTGSSPLVRAAVHGVARRLNGDSVQLLDGPVTTREEVNDLTAAAPLVDLLLCSFEEHRLAELLAEEMAVPVVNLTSNWAAPCQILADYYTIFRYSDGFEKLRYFGRGDRYCHSLMRAAAIFDFRLEICPPSGGGPDEVLLRSLVERGAPIELRRSSGELPSTGWVYLGRGAEAALFPEFDELINSSVDFLLAPARPWRGRRKLTRREATGSHYRQQLVNLAAVTAACCYRLAHDWPD